MVDLHACVKMLYISDHVLILPSSSVCDILMTHSANGISAILFIKVKTCYQFNLKMPRKQKGAYNPNYTKVFSNVANPFLEVEFMHDNRDPFEELNDLPRFVSYHH